jgi:FkbM family methyltransferase
MTIKHQGLTALRRMLRPFDLWIGRQSLRPEASRARLIETANIDWILDVGAHIGEFPAEVRSEGWRGRIDSFEPDPRSIDRLTRRASRVDTWTVHSLAAGNFNGTTTLHLAGNEMSSSTLSMMPRHVRSSPESAIVDVAEVPIVRLDSLITPEQHNRIFLKIDVQGTEDQAIEGSRGFLGNVKLIQLELSLQPLYEGQTDWREIVEGMNDSGFQLVFIAPDFTDMRTGEMLQFDGVFLHESCSD